MELFIARSNWTISFHVTLIIYLYECERASANVCIFSVKINLTSPHRRRPLRQLRRRRRCRRSRRRSESPNFRFVSHPFFFFCFNDLLAFAVLHAHFAINRQYHFTYFLWSEEKNDRKWLKYFSRIPQAIVVVVKYTAHARIAHTTSDWLTATWYVVIGSCVHVCARSHRRHVYNDQLNCLETDSEVECDYGAHNFLHSFFASRSLNPNPFQSLYGLLSWITTFALCSQSIFASVRRLLHSWLPFTKFASDQTKWLISSRQ